MVSTWSCRLASRNYYDLRPSIAIPKPEIGNADAAINLDGFFGLHPSMSSFKPLWDSKRLAIVHASGSPDNTRSHFDAQDYMESATPGVKSTSDGWLNRYLQSKKDPERSSVSRRVDDANDAARACRDALRRWRCRILQTSQFAPVSRRQMCRAALKRSTHDRTTIRSLAWAGRLSKQSTI